MASLPEYTQALHDARMKMSADEFAAHLEERVAALPDLARRNIAKSAARMDAQDTTVVAKALAALFPVIKVIDSGALVKGGIIDYSAPDPSAPDITPLPDNAPNVLSGAPGRSVGNGDKVRAILERHRHPGTGRIQSPSRGAEQIQKTEGGRFTYVIGQSGSTPAAP